MPDEERRATPMILIGAGTGSAGYPNGSSIASWTGLVRKRYDRHVANAIEANLKF